MKTTDNGTIYAQDGTIFNSRVKEGQRVFWATANIHTPRPDDANDTDLEDTTLGKNLIVWEGTQAGKTIKATILPTESYPQKLVIFESASCPMEMGSTCNENPRGWIFRTMDEMIGDWNNTPRELIESFRRVDANAPAA